MGFFRKSKEDKAIAEAEERAEEARERSQVRGMSDTQLIMLAIIEHDSAGDQALAGTTALEEMVERLNWDPYDPHFRDQE